MFRRGTHTKVVIRLPYAKLQHHIYFFPSAYTGTGSFAFFFFFCGSLLRCSVLEQEKGRAAVCSFDLGYIFWGVLLRKTRGKEPHHYLYRNRGVPPLLVSNVPDENELVRGRSKMISYPPDLLRLFRGAQSDTGTAAPLRHQKKRVCLLPFRVCIAALFSFCIFSGIVTRSRTYLSLTHVLG